MAHLFGFAGSEIVEHPLHIHEDQAPSALPGAHRQQHRPRVNGDHLQSSRRKQQFQPEKIKGNADKLS